MFQERLAERIRDMDLHQEESKDFVGSIIQARRKMVLNELKFLQDIRIQMMRLRETLTDCKAQL